MNVVWEKDQASKQQKWELCTYIDFLCLSSIRLVKVFMLSDQCFHTIKGIPQIVISKERLWRENKSSKYACDVVKGLYLLGMWRLISWKRAQKTTPKHLHWLYILLQMNSANLWQGCKLQSGSIQLRGKTRGAFHYAWQTGQRPVELTEGKCNDSVRKKQNFQLNQSIPFRFDWNFDYFSVKGWLETGIFEHGRASFSQTRPTGQRGPPLEVNHFPPKNIHLDWRVPFLFRPKATQESTCCEKITEKFIPPVLSWWH